MTLKDIILADFDTIAADLGNPVLTWQGEDYPCLIGPAGESLVLEIGGMERQADLVILVKKNVFTDNLFPQEQQKLIFRAKSYRIAKITIDSFDAALQLTLVSDTRGI